MRKSHPVAVAMAIGVIVAGTRAWAQTQAPAAAPRRVAAILDMGEIMKNSNRFNAAMERLKAQYEAKAKELQKEGERGNQLTEEMRQMPANSPERKAAEDRLLKMRADYELKGKRITDEIRDSESKIVLGLTEEVRAELAKFTQATGTPLVLRANPTPPNLTDPRVILQEIHKPIVYQANLDVTKPVLDSLNRGTAPVAPAATPGVGPAAAPRNPVR
jgi:Skp family chaperone for outer membrane proteins